MKTAYDLLHRSNPNLGYTDNRGSFGTMPEAAGQVADPERWESSPNPGIWGYHASPTDQWLIAERQVPETDAERIELVLDLLASYGQDDGAHHKAWAIDQAVRLLAGDGYEQWVTEYRDGEDGPDTYAWDEGIAP